MLRIRITKNEEVVEEWRSGGSNGGLGIWAGLTLSCSAIQKISAIKFRNHKLCMPRNPVRAGSRASCGYMISCARFNHVRNPFVTFLTLNGVKYDS